MLEKCFNRVAIMSQLSQLHYKNKDCYLSDRFNNFTWQKRCKSVRSPSLTLLASQCLSKLTPLKNNNII